MSIRDPGKVTDLVGVQPDDLARREAGLLEHVGCARTVGEAVIASSTARSSCSSSVRRSSRRCRPNSRRTRRSSTCASRCARSRRSSARATRATTEIDELRAKLEAAQLPVEARQGGGERTRTAAHHSAGVGRTHRRAHLPRVDRQPAVVGVDRGQPRHAARADQVLDEDHYDLEKIKDRILEYPRRAQAEERHQGPDPVLRRPARDRQDLARALDRPCPGTQVRAHVARRHPRRGGDPRPPPHLHRLAARAHHPEPAHGRREQPGVRARRDRQARHRLPRRPGFGAARGARPGAEQHLPSTTTSTCRSTCRR